MNIFVLDPDPATAAKQHCDQHVLKMIIEYAQLLATAHRMCDGYHKRVTYTTKTGKRRTKSVWVHPNPDFEDGLYSATHVNHPSAIWARECDKNYIWLCQLWASCVSEYRYRYGKCHKTWESQSQFLRKIPAKIKRTEVMTPFPQAMPDEYKLDDSVEAYRSFYINEKSRFATWNKNRPAPSWYVQGQLQHV